MTAATGPVPDDVIYAVAEAMCRAMGGEDPYNYRGVAVDALAVPAVAEVFARDAAVREIVEHYKLSWWVDEYVPLQALAALFDGGDRP